LTNKKKLLRIIISIYKKGGEFTMARKKAKRKKRKKRKK